MSQEVYFFQEKMARNIFPTQHFLLWLRGKASLIIAIKEGFR